MHVIIGPSREALEAKKRPITKVVAHNAPTILSVAGIFVDSLKYRMFTESRIDR